MIMLRPTSAISTPHPALPAKHLVDVGQVIYRQRFVGGIDQGPRAQCVRAWSSGAERRIGWRARALVGAHDGVTGLPSWVSISKRRRPLTKLT
jgi:hypothetical protein